MTNVSYNVINETGVSHIERNKNVSQGMFTEVTLALLATAQKPETHHNHATHKHHLTTNYRVDANICAELRRIPRYQTRM